MIPEDRLSTTPVTSGFLNPEPARPIISYHYGPFALQDASQGLFFQLWTAEIDFDTIYVWAPNTARTDLHTHSIEIKQISLAFDQNGFATFAFVDNDGAAFLHWYDSTIPGYTTTALAAGTITPRVTMDDARTSQNIVNDIILAYVRDGALYYRQQRDRYLIERHLMNDVELLYHMSMNNTLRLQWKYKGGGLPYAPFLADVVTMLCRRASIPVDSINVDDLYDVTVQGMKFGGDDDTADHIDTLRKMFFFDKSEYDKIIHWPRRGKNAVARIPYNKLIAASPSSLKRTLKDDAELPKSVVVNHLDPAGGFARNSQRAQRRSNLVAATKEKKLEAQVILTADQAATAAEVTLRTEWYEQDKFAFATDIEYSYVCNADVVEVEDKKGNWHRIRVTEKNESGLVIEFEGIQDAGEETYSALGIGNSLPPPTSTTPGNIGETLIEIINISPLRDADDKVGVYVAVAGDSSAWFGTDLLVSTDNGVTYFDALQIQTPGTIGETLTDLEDEVSAEYPADQSFEVTVNFGLESTTYDNLHNNLNRCIVGDEMLQFQTAFFLGMVGNKYRYRLSGLIRGRNATEVAAWPSGTRFVLIDSSVVFIEAPQWMIGKEIYFKPVSLGLTEDETVPTSYDFDDVFSQTEWPVTHIEAERDGSSNVTVTFIGRPRLGIETAPRHSQYFTGYRIKFSNGHIINTTDQFGTYASAPGGVTVQVCAMNSITGEGPYSTAIPT